MSSDLLSDSDDTIMHQDKNIINKNNLTQLIQCTFCCRSFYTQAQFGQHSRICREGKAIIRHLIPNENYKYSFLEKQTKQNVLEIKSRFILIIDEEKEKWKDISKKNGLNDTNIKKILQLKKLLNVDVAIRNRKASGLVIVNFMVKNVSQNSNQIHLAKISIENAVNVFENLLPNNINMKLHLCKINKCRELVIRDTEGYCSRHRAQKYHKKNKNKLNNNINNEPPPPLLPIIRTTKEDEKIVAQILTDLKNKKTNLENFQPPKKKQKLNNSNNSNNNNNNNIIYMLPIPIALLPYYTIPMQLINTDTTTKIKQKK